MNNEPTYRAVIEVPPTDDNPDGTLSSVFWERHGRVTPLDQIIYQMARGLRDTCYRKNIAITDVNPTTTAFSHSVYALMVELDRANFEDAVVSVKQMLGYAKDFDHDFTRLTRSVLLDKRWRHEDLPKLYAMAHPTIPDMLKDRFFTPQLMARFEALFIDALARMVIPADQYEKWKTEEGEQ